MEIRKISVAGHDVDVYTFNKKSFYYPSFNGNAEFPVTSKGYRDLSHYLRNLNYVGSLVDKILEKTLK